MKDFKDQMLEETADFLIVYMKAGKIGIQSFLKKLNLNINNLEQLLNIHFLMKDEVKHFAKDLPVLIKRFKTSTKLLTKQAVGEVRGQINWADTVKKRMNTNPKDSMLFVLNERNRTYEIKENLVLKACIDVIFQLLNKKVNVKKLSGYQWFHEWQSLRLTVNDLYAKNIYLKRVDLANQKVTDRMIKDTLKHRNPLYRKAARILYLYRKIMRFEVGRDEIMQLLEDTFITPDSEDVLFELYWVIQLIKQNAEGARFNLIDGSSNMVASWEDGERRYEIYHDSTGSKALKFEVGVDEIVHSDNPYLQHKAMAFLQSQQLAGEMFDYAVDRYVWLGRPDIIVEVKKKQTYQLEKVVLGEVKNTSRLDYAVKGLSELVEYINLVKDKNGGYVNDTDLKVNGILFVGDVKANRFEDEQLKVVSYDSHARDDLKLK